MDYTALTDQAFGFLEEEHGFVAQPAQKGGNRNPGHNRAYLKDRLLVNVVFGVLDGSVRRRYGVYFIEDFDADWPVIRLVDQSIWGVLERKGISFDVEAFAANNSLSPKRRLAEMAMLVREHAQDLLAGDFSVFPEQVYVLAAVTRSEMDTRPEEKLIGTYSVMSKVREAMDQWNSDKVRARHLFNFKIYRTEIDGSGFACLPQ